jgi:hypothetical protein
VWPRLDTGKLRDPLQDAEHDGLRASELPPVAKGGLVVGFPGNGSSEASSAVGRVAGGAVSRFVGAGELDSEVSLRGVAELA